MLTQASVESCGGADRGWYQTADPWAPLMPSLRTAETTVRELKIKIKGEINPKAVFL